LALEGYTYKLKLNDTGGLEEQSQIPTRYVESDGFILVYSITDLQRFDLCHFIDMNVFFALLNSLAFNITFSILLALEYWNKYIIN
jgi:hypothetical protein